MALRHQLALGGPLLGALLLAQCGDGVLLVAMTTSLVSARPGWRAIADPTHGEAVPASGGVARQPGVDAARN